MKRAIHKHNQDKNEDRISDLPDCVILHILSFLKARQAVQTCILSTRWKNVWKYLSTLTLSSFNFIYLKGFTKFVSKILSLRDDSTALQVLDFNRPGVMESHLLKRILKYAVSHNVQRLKINVHCKIQHFPRSLLSCHTLKSLELQFVSINYHHKPLFPDSLNLPVLTSLSLHNFFFSVGDDGRIDPFSTFNMLNSLIINGCLVGDKQNLYISSATLVNLTIRTGHFGGSHPWNAIKFELSTPNLCNFVYSGTPLQKLCGSMNNLSSIKYVKIGTVIPLDGLECRDTPLVLLNWLVELVNTESLTISSYALKVLSSFPDLLKIEFPSLCNLKSLKVDRLPPARPIPDGIVDFLLQNAPLAKVDIIC